MVETTTTEGQPPTDVQPVIEGQPNAETNTQKETNADALLNNDINVNGDAATTDDKSESVQPKFEEQLAERGIDLDELTEFLAQKQKAKEEAEKPKAEAKEWIDFVASGIEKGEFTKEEILAYESNNRPNGREIAFQNFKEEFTPEDAEEFESLSEEEKEELITEKFLEDFDLDNLTPAKRKVVEKYFTDLESDYESTKFGKIEQARLNRVSEANAASMVKEHVSLFNDIVSKPQVLKVKVEDTELDVEIKNEIDFKEYRKTITDEITEAFYKAFQKDADSAKQMMQMHINQFLAKEQMDKVANAVAEKAYETAREKYSRGDRAPFVNKEIELANTEGTNSLVEGFRRAQEKKR